MNLIAKVPFKLCFYLAYMCSSLLQYSHLLLYVGSPSNLPGSCLCPSLFIMAAGGACFSVQEKNKTFQSYSFDIQFSNNIKYFKKWFFFGAHEFFSHRLKSSWFGSRSINIYLCSPYGKMLKYQFLPWVFCTAHGDVNMVCLEDASHNQCCQIKSYQGKISEKNIQIICQLRENQNMIVSILTFNLSTNLYSISHYPFTNKSHTFKDMKDLLPSPACLQAW